jgi:glycosyltransferase involved in cell wall biosynthesis
MNAERVDVSVCLCTYKRPELLRRCLLHLLSQVTSKRFEIVVVDNDSNGSGSPVVDSFRGMCDERGVRLQYDIEMQQNISLARNRTLGLSKGGLVAFIDDDEAPVPGWLESLCQTIESTGADAVLGPVLPAFPDGFPDWQRRGGFFDRTRFATGTTIEGSSCRTGNILVRRQALNLRTGPFDPQYGRTGGEDSDLFEWLGRQGCKFRWNDDAIVYELQESLRQAWRWHIRRAFSGGWGHSRRQVLSRGLLVGGSSSVLRSTPALIRNLGRAARHVANPRAALLHVCCSWDMWLGRLGYFFGVTLHRYRRR